MLIGPYVVHVKKQTACEGLERNHVVYVKKRTVYVEVAKYSKIVYNILTFIIWSERRAIA